MLSGNSGCIELIILRHASTTTALREEVASRWILVSCYFVEVMAETISVKISGLDKLYTGHY